MLEMQKDGAEGPICTAYLGMQEIWNYSNIAIWFCTGKYEYLGT